MRGGPTNLRFSDYGVKSMTGPDGDIVNQRTTAVSIVVPCYNEASNIPVLYERLRKVLDSSGITWEIIAVDDHSRDKTFELLTSLSQRDQRVSIIRLARNVGSHIALMCGLEHSCGGAAVMIAGDLQDPPEIILRLLAKWRDGDQIVWAARSGDEDRTRTAHLFSRLYRSAMAKILDNPTSAGSDLVLIDRIVVDAVTQHREANLSIFAILSWLGFRQGVISYTKEARKVGSSGWTLKKKIKLFIDSVTAFSYFPIRFMSMFGCIVALIGCIYAGVVIIDSFFGSPVEGWTSLMVVVLTMGGLQMAMLGVLGEYVWRNLDESRRRPRYNIQYMAGPARRREIERQKDCVVEPSRG
jgi:polyisoprenyl-phosphate glycosyltransferase